VSFGVELAVLALVLIQRRTMGKQLFAGAAVLLVALLMVSWLGVEQILQRFSSFQSSKPPPESVAPCAGTPGKSSSIIPYRNGARTLQIVYPLYESLYDGKIVNHSHNDYLEALAETGVLGGLCCAWFLGVLFSESLNDCASSTTPLPGPCSSPGWWLGSGFLVHSLVDSTCTSLRTRFCFSLWPTWLPARYSLWLPVRIPEVAPSKSAK